MRSASRISAFNLVSAFHLHKCRGSLKWMGPGFKNGWDPAGFEPQTSRAVEQRARPLATTTTFFVLGSLFFLFLLGSFSPQDV